MLLNQNMNYAMPSPVGDAPRTVGGAIASSYHVVVHSYEYELIHTLYKASAIALIHISILQRQKFSYSYCVVSGLPLISSVLSTERAYYVRTRLFMLIYLPVIQAAVSSTSANSVKKRNALTI